jgi:hypothetical protein
MRPLSYQGRAACRWFCLPLMPFDLRFANHAFHSTRCTLDPLLRLVRGLRQHRHDHIGIGISPSGMGRKNRLANLELVLHGTLRSAS